MIESKKIQRKQVKHTNLPLIRRKIMLFK